MTRFKSIAEAREKLGDKAADQIEAQYNQDVLAKVNKYKNKRVVREDVAFDSMLEARIYDDLCRQFGKDGVIRQVSIPLANGKRIRPDFMVIHSRNMDGTFVASFIDAKGYPTSAWTAKANHFEDKYGIEIQLRGK